MAKDLVKEAYAQVDAMRDAATETAKNILIEAMSTDLKAAVAQAMSDTLSDEEENQPVSEEVEETSEEVVEETAEAGEEVSESDDIEGEEDISEEVEEIAEAPKMEMDDEDDDDDDEDDEDDMMDDEDDDEDEEMEEGMDKEEYKMTEDEEVIEVLSKEEMSEDVEELRNQISELHKEKQVYEQALRKVKKQMDEINLFNARLAAATDLMRTVPLTKGQKEQVVENFDAAKSLGEVKRLHKILVETFKGNEEKTVRKARVTRPNVQSVVTEAKEETATDSAFERLSKLAGV